MTTWRVRTIQRSTGTVRDVALEAEAESSTTDLLDALTAIGCVERPVTLHGTDVTTVPTIGQLRLAHGDALVCGGPPVEPPAREPGTYAVVVAGPSAGAYWQLPEGRSVTVGRSARSDVRISDTLVSGTHLQMRSEPDGVVVVEDLDSTHGTWVEGEAAHEPTSIGPGDYVQLGSSVLTVSHVAASDLPDITPTSEPTWVFDRRYRSAQAELGDLPSAPRPPADEEHEPRSPLVALLIPMITSAGFAIITGRLWFLALMALGPIARYWEQKRREGKAEEKKAREQEAYQQRLAAHRERLAAARRVELHRRRTAAVSGGEAALYAAVRHVRLWEREPDDHDFAAVTIGLASLPSNLDGDDGSAVWGTPLQISLPRTGAIAVRGEPGKARAVARSILLNLSVTHSPMDLHVWVLGADGQGEDWGFVRWLPHAFDGSRSARLALTEQDRVAAMSRLRRIVDNREEVGEATLQLPIHAVVIDQTASVSSAELTDLLRRGAQVGVIGIVLDPRIEPEGVRGTLRLSRDADRASYESRVQAPVDEVVTAEVEPDVAEDAARRMSGLQPAGASEAGDVGEVRLTELADLVGVDGRTMAQRWQQRSPSTAALVGVSSGSPLSVDFVRDGPHGLIGGTNGSGKTEFLQTLLTSLCCNNHPDDLSILLVDFKGGVDHKQTAKLPHVLTLVTNTDIDRFERTIEMLRAEQLRRQELFAPSGANLDAYRAARQRDPSLPPVPRLLVIADEFSELLDSDVGRAHLKSLESVARVGRALGIHLLLLTQNFVGQLPDQIAANAGLRISFRVEEPAHSKIVLSSDVAASIPASRPGRAWIRQRGSDLVELQGARVANRRVDLQTGPPPVEVAEVPITEVAAAERGRGGASVPHDETDLHSLTGALQAASAVVDWSGSAIPWPDELPEHVPLVDVLSADLDDAIPIGLADDPEHQRRRVPLLTGTDEQLLVVGGPAVRTGEVLRTLGITAALTAPASRRHLYAIDVAGTALGALGELPHCVAASTRDDELGLRILREVTEIASRRKAELATRGASHVKDLDDPWPDVLVLLDGVDRLMGGGDAAASPLLGATERLVAESIGTGVRVILGGTPRVASHRIGSGIDRRLVLRTAEEHEVLGIGVPRRRVPELRVDGRAFDTGTGLVVQLPEVRGTPVGVTRALAAEMQLDGHGGDAPAPLQNVSWPLPWERIDPDSLRVPQGYVDALPVAIDSSSGRWLWIDAEEEGPVVGVTGPARSGRSATLLAIAEVAQDLGWHIVALTGSRRSPLARGGPAAMTRVEGPAELAAACEQLRQLDRPLVVLVDDLHRFELDRDELAPVFARDRLLVFVAAPPNALSSTSFTRAVPSMRTVLLLSPSSSLGLGLGLGRLPERYTVEARPGRGVLSISGDLREAQVPLVPSIT